MGFNRSMIVCLHHTMCAASRAVRILLAEKGLEAEFKSVAPWQRHPEFLGLNPAGELPVIIHDGVVVAGIYPILEYLEEVFPDPGLFGDSAVPRAEARRLTHWFLCKFQNEVTDPLVGEKIVKRIAGTGTPSSRAISAGRQNIHIHLDYISWLMDRRSWLAGEHMTMADLVAGAQISVVDFAGEVPWTRHVDVKEWYARVKSRPSFRAILQDKLTGIFPPAHYTDLDF